jgi:ABC-type antimicrobial peptide transport system permease subunit
MIWRRCLSIATSRGDDRGWCGSCSFRSPPGRRSRIRRRASGSTSGVRPRSTSFSEVAFKFRITPLLLVEGLSFAALMGAAGGLLPALRAARIPVARALREI